MSSATSDDRSRDADLGTERQSSYCVPRRITEAGLREFHDAVREFAAHLVQELDLQGHQMQRTEPQYTADDVHAAKQSQERRLGEEFRTVDADRHVLAAILLTIATVGVSVMANFLHSDVQLVVFVAFVVTGVVGLVLTWTSRAR